MYLIVKRNVKPALLFFKTAMHKCFFFDSVSLSLVRGKQKIFTRALSPNVLLLSFE